jgi:uncharacterized protein YgiM (DUF1202 family)
LTNGFRNNGAGGNKSCPGSNHPIVNKLAKDDQVFVLEEEAGWAKIALNSWWVNKMYLREF